MNFLTYLGNASTIVLRQRKEMIELFGVEKRNSYDIVTSENVTAGSAIEMPRGWFGVLLRQLLKHWRTFTVKIYDDENKEVLNIHHPFRFYFQRLDVTGPNGTTIGSMERRFSILSKKFVIHVAHNQSEITMTSGFFKIWTFPFVKNGRDAAAVKKQWGGALKEMFLDADTFLIEIIDSTLSIEERQLILSAAVIIDLNYFEENQSVSLTNILDS